MLYNKKRIVLILCLVLAFSVIAIANKVVSEETVRVSDKVKEVGDCQTFSWQEEENTFGVCTREISEIVCDDAPINESCHNETREMSYNCVNGTKTAEKTSKNCKQKGFLINDVVKLNTQEYECSTQEENDKVIVVCDSRFDGNGDGICTSGESCVKFIIGGDKVQQYEKNSRDDFIETDESFFLERASTEVLK